jgi:hypothetical protein
MLFGLVGGHGIPPECCVLAFVVLYFLSGWLQALWIPEDARKRGASGTFWVTIVVVFNVPGLVAYLLFRSDVNVGGCPKCGGRLLPSLRHCLRCGHQPSR